MIAKSGSVFDHLGITPVINCCGAYTDLGGSRISPTVWAAMEQLNGNYAYLPEILEVTGTRIASLLGAEAALIVPGSSAAIMLGTGACMAGMSRDISARLPDVTGAKQEVLIQSSQRYSFDRQATMPGATIVEVGSEFGTRIDQLEKTISSNTAMFLYPAHLEGRPGVLSIDDVVAVCAAHNVPVFVDAAYMCYPISKLTEYNERGVDLVTMSSKYFCGPNAGGFIMGRKDLIDAVNNVYFTRYETGGVLKYGRPMKMDRQMVVAVVLALEAWLETDHDERFQQYANHAFALEEALQDIPGLTLEPMHLTMDERLVPGLINCLVVSFSVDCKLNANSLEVHLAKGNPSISVLRDGKRIVFALDRIRADEVTEVGKKIKESADAA